MKRGCLFVVGIILVLLALGMSFGFPQFKTFTGSDGKEYIDTGIRLEFKLIPTE